MSTIPGRGSKISHATRHSRPKKKKKKVHVRGDMSHEQLQIGLGSLKV